MLHLLYASEEERSTLCRYAGGGNDKSVISERVFGVVYLLTMSSWAANTLLSQHLHKVASASISIHLPSSKNTHVILPFAEHPLNPKMARSFKDDKSAPLFGEEAQTFNAPPAYSALPKDGIAQRLSTIFASGPLMTSSRLDRIISLAEEAATAEGRKAMMESIQSMVEQEVNERERSKERIGRHWQVLVGELFYMLVAACALVLGILAEFCCMLFAVAGCSLACCILPSAVLLLLIYGLTKL